MEEGKTKGDPELLRACRDAGELWEWVRRHLKMEVPRKAFCAHHDAPFAYLEHAYFEPSSDVVVWAPRGGGKTRLAAAATLLDVLHKPGTVVRILGGSMEQSLRVWEHLLPELEMVQEKEEGQVKKMKAMRVELASGSSVAAIPQSAVAVRGIRVQKLRCDEVDEFKPRIWRAAGATTRSRMQPGVPTLAPHAPDEPIRIEGVVEALSTLHNAGGVMSKIIEPENGRPPRVIKWCILDVMAKCGPEHACETCDLHEDCRGRAKTEAEGFIPVSDVLAIKRRVSLEMWQTELLCLRPTGTGRVFPQFEFEVHARDVPFDGELSLGLDFGFANPLVALWVGRGADGTVHVVDEWSMKEKPIEEHIKVIKSRRPVARIHCDPAGRARNDQTGKSNIKVLKEAGYEVRSCASGIVEGIERIRRLVMDANKVPRLVVDPKCKTLIQAMLEYAYPERPRDELPDKDGKHDHPIDALRYWLANEGKVGMQTRRY